MKRRTIWIDNYFIKKIEDDEVVITIPREYGKEGDYVNIFVLTFPSQKKAKGKIRVMSGRRVKLPRKIIKGEKLIFGWLE